MYAELARLHLVVIQNRHELRWMTLHDATNFAALQEYLLYVNIHINIDVNVLTIPCSIIQINVVVNVVKVAIM